MNKKLKIVSVFFLLLLIVLFIAWILTYPVPDVMGLPYSEAREKIMNSGWVPLPTKNKESRWKDIQNSYQEVRFCVDDEAAEAHLCVFGFSRWKIQCLRIVTTGEAVSAFRVVQVGRECE